MVWKKSDDPQVHQPESSMPPRPVTASSPAPSPAPASSEPQRHTNTTSATIGPSIFIKGDLTGEEDLVVEGRVEGKVDLKQNNVTVGKNGRVKADIFGRVVIIEGEVDGNVFAREQAILRQSGAIRGNITAPRVILEDGSRFKGSIDMEPPKENAGGGSYSRQQDRDRSEQREQNRPEAVGAKASA